MSPKREAAEENIHLEGSTVPRIRGKKVQRDLFEMASEFEQAHPGIVEAMQLVGISMEKYEASLNALYSPKIVTSNSTEDLNAHME